MSSLSATMVTVFLQTLFLLLTLTHVKCFHYVSQINATDIGRTSFTLEWDWVIDDEADNDLYGYEIITSVYANRITDASEVVVLNDTATNYTVAENITSWTRYISCITPIVLSGTTHSKGMNTTCSEIFQTLYDPWTTKAQAAVLVTVGLIAALIIAVIVNTVWPRSQKRTFSLDTSENDDESKDGNGELDDGGKTNFGFNNDEDAGSVEEDWNAAAIAAMRNPSGKQWSRQTDMYHQTTKLFADLKPPTDDVNHNEAPGQLDVQFVDGEERHGGDRAYDEMGAAAEVVDGHNEYPRDYSEPPIQDYENNEAVYQNQEYQDEVDHPIYHNPQDRGYQDPHSYYESANYHITTAEIEPTGFY